MCCSGGNVHPPPTGGGRVLLPSDLTPPSIWLGLVWGGMGRGREGTLIKWPHPTSLARSGLA